jgi:hypothetical protein
MLGPKCQELLDVSFGELVLSSSDDKRKEDDAPSDLYFKSSVPSDVSVVSTAPSDLSDESSDASLSKKSIRQIWVFDYASRIHHDYSSRFLVLRAMLPELAAEKANVLTLNVRDYSNRMLHHAMLPALSVDKVKELTRKGLTLSKPNSILSRILYLVVMVAAITFASSTRQYNEKTFQSSPERAPTTVALEPSLHVLFSSDVPVVQPKKTNKIRESLKKFGRKLVKKTS